MRGADVRGARDTVERQRRIVQVGVDVTLGVVDRARAFRRLPLGLADIAPECGGGEMREPRPRFGA
jgi:hypothetical protein